MRVKRPIPHQAAGVICSARSAPSPRHSQSNMPLIIGLPCSLGEDRRFHMAANRPMRIILLAAILVVGGSTLFFKYRESSPGRSSDPGDVVTVLLADQYIPTFTVIKPDLV